MKKFVTKYAAYIVLAVMFALLIPGISNRIENEQKNDNVTISVLYNSFRGTISEEKLDETMNKFKEMGIDTVTVTEDDLNSFVQRGDVTSIKYNVLRHKYDDESMRIADLIAEKCPNVTYDSHIVIAGRDEAKARLSYVLPRKYTYKEFCDVGAFEDLRIYVFYDGKKELYEYSLGYDEELIAKLMDDGFKIALSYQVKNLSTIEYYKDIERIAKGCNVEYLNLKMHANEYTGIETDKFVYLDLAGIINRNNMTLVVTENADQLSNQKFTGYDNVFSMVMCEGGSQKVVRAYETFDDSQQDATKYKYKVEQFLNSTVDRNIRFVSVVPLNLTQTSHDECVDFTLKAAGEYKKKIENLGFSVNGETEPLDYSAHHRTNAAACAVIMIMCLLLMYRMVSGKNCFRLTLGAMVLGALAAAGTLFVVPMSLISLYPTVFCVVQSCMAMTVVLYFLKKAKDKMSALLLAPLSICILLGVLLLGAVGMGAMLSGIEFYVNNVIFRGIKVSLIVPIVYTAVVYYFMFVKENQSSLVTDVKKVLCAEVKVYWLLIGAVVGAVGLYYLVRSGNVSSISDGEKALRSTVTEMFTERPRTKEFLIGYPALVLFAYYMKNSDIQLIKWLLAIAASILAASVTNSFCHIFTDFLTIVARTMNGLILGVVIAAVAYVANVIVL